MLKIEYTPLVMIGFLVVIIIFITIIIFLIKRFKNKKRLFVNKMTTMRIPKQ